MELPIDHSYARRLLCEGCFKHLYHGHSQTTVECINERWEGSDGAVEDCHEQIHPASVIDECHQHLVLSYDTHELGEETLERRNVKRVGIN